jgi:hypothetical protein
MHPASAMSAPFCTKTWTHGAVLVQAACIHSYLGAKRVLTRYYKNELCIKDLKEGIGEIEIYETAKSQTFDKFTRSHPY